MRPVEAYNTIDETQNTHMQNEMVKSQSRTFLQ